MALSSDVKTIRYGTPDGHQPLNKGLTASATIYRGSIATLDGTSGYLDNPSTPSSTDIVLGIVASAGPGTANVGPGIEGGTTDGEVLVNIATGSFILASGTGSDLLDVTTNGKTVYLVDEITVGKTDGGGSRPAAGVQLSCSTDDPSIPSGYVAVKLGTPSSPLGGP